LLYSVLDDYGVNVNICRTGSKEMLGGVFPIREVHSMSLLLKEEHTTPSPPLANEIRCLALK